MTDDYATCSLCMEAYDLVDRIPKSLGCRHYFCEPCLTSHMESQHCCPSCRQQIDNTDNIVDELAMIDYLEIQQERKQKEMREELQRLVNAEEKEYERIEKEISHHNNSILITATDKSCIYSRYTKYLMKRSIDYCTCGTNIFKTMSKYELEMEDRLRKVRLSLTKLKSLLGKDYIRKEYFDKCQMEATSTFNTESAAVYAESRMWDGYREILLEKLTELSKEPINYDVCCIPGNIAHMIKFGEPYSEYIYIT